MMAEENTVQVKFGVKLDQLFSGLDQAKNAVKTQTDQMKSSLDGMGKESEKSIGSAFRGIAENIKTHMGSAAGSTSGFAEHAKNAANIATEGFGALPGVLGGVTVALGAVAAAALGLFALHGAAKAATDYTEAAMDLGRQLGVSATSAGTWMAVLDDVGASSGDLVAATRGLTRNLKENEDQMNKWGVVTRDGSGHLLNMDEMLQNAIKTTNEYTEGTERNMAAQAIFGRGVQGGSRLLLANTEVIDENKAKLAELGGLVGVESVEAWQAFDTANDNMKRGMTALTNVIGTIAAPVLAKIIDMFASAMPYAIGIAKVAVGAIMEAFWLLRNGVVVVWETINAMVVSVTEPLRALASALYKAVNGDWEGAKSELKNIGDVISGTWSSAMDNMTKSSTETVKRINAIWGETTAIDAPGKGKRTAPQSSEKKKDEKGGGKQSVDKSEMGAWEAANNAEKARYEMANGLRQRDLAEDVAYWNAKAAEAEKAEAVSRALGEAGIASAKVHADDKLKALAKAAAAELAQMKKQAAEGKALSEQMFNESEKSALNGVDLARISLEQKFALGEINEAQMIAQEKDLEAQRYAIQQNAQELRLMLAEQDPTTSPAALQIQKDKLLEIERTHLLKKAMLEKQAAIEQNKNQAELFKSLESGMAHLLQGIMTGATKMKDIFRSVWEMILQSFTQMAAKMVAQWAMTQLKQLIMSKTTAMSEVGAQSAVAGASAVASTAAIPIVGPALAPAAGIAAYANAMSYMGLASARGGFDIPAGLNPITQLHEKEMVLPQAQADAVRDMANGGGKAGGEQHIHIHATDAQGVARLFRDNGEHLVAALKQQRRNLAF